jgi:hypothetical protein
VPHGRLCIHRLCDEARVRPQEFLQLRYVARALDRRLLRYWRRDPERPRLQATTRFAAVGLLGRSLDALFRLSLMLRGRVPYGRVAAAHLAYRASPGASRFP